MVTNQNPKDITDPLKITLFTKHLFNQEIRKTVCKGTYRTLKEAFDSALLAEYKAKKFEGLTDESPAVLALNINKIEANDQRNNPKAPFQNSGYKPNNRNYNQFHGQANTCWKCGERGHYA